MITKKKYVKIKLRSYEDLPLQTTPELYNIIIAVTSVFHDGNK